MRIGATSEAIAYPMPVAIDATKAAMIPTAAIPKAVRIPGSKIARSSCVMAPPTWLMEPGEPSACRDSAERSKDAETRRRRQLSRYAKKARKGAVMRLMKESHTWLRTFAAAWTALLTAALKFAICCANQFPTCLSSLSTYWNAVTAITIAAWTMAVTTVTRPSQTFSHHGRSVGGPHDDVQN